MLAHQREAPGDGVGRGPPQPGAPQGVAENCLRLVPPAAVVGAALELLAGRGREVGTGLVTPGVSR